MHLLSDTHSLLALLATYLERHLDPITQVVHSTESGFGYTTSSVI